MRRRCLIGSSGIEILAGGAGKGAAWSVVAIEVLKAVEMGLRASTERGRSQTW
jgi:hypothetical protein